MSFSSNETLWKNGAFQAIMIMFAILFPIALIVNYYSALELDEIKNMTCSELQETFLKHNIRSEDNRSFAYERYLGLGCE